MFVLLRNVMYHSIYVFGERFKEVLDLICATNEKCIQVIQQKATIKDRDLLNEFFFVAGSILCSRNFNIHLKYNDRIISELKKISIIVDSDKRTQRKTDVYNHMKIESKRSLLKALLMRENYQEIVDKHLSFMESTQIVKTDCVGNFFLIFFFFNFFFFNFFFFNFFF